MIETALKVSYRLVIGLTNKEMLKNKKFYSNIESYETRKRNPENFIRSFTDVNRVKIVKLNDPYGPPIQEPDYEGLVVNQETYSAVLKMNEIRESNGFKSLIIIIIPIIKDKNNQKISSIKVGEFLP